MSLRLPLPLLNDDNEDWKPPTNQTHHQHEPTHHNAWQSESNSQNRRTRRCLYRPLAARRSSELMYQTRVLSVTPVAPVDRQHPKSDRPLARVRGRAIARPARTNRVAASWLEFESAARRIVLAVQRPNHAQQATRDEPPRDRSHAPSGNH